MKKNNQKPQQYKNTIPSHKFINSPKKNNSTLLIFIAFCFPVLLYLQTINFGFTGFDDEMIITKNITFLSNFRNVHQAFLTDAFIDKSSSFYRPIQTLSYMVDIKLSGGNNPWMYHLSNIFLLGLIACSLFLLLRQFLIPQKLALLGTLVYCTHPLFISSIAWIPARGDLLLTLFSLVSFSFFIEFLQKKKSIYLLLNWVAFTIALFCKETAAVLILLFITYFCLFSSEKHFEKKILFIIFLYAISGICWFWLHSKAIEHYSDTNTMIGLAAVLSNLQTIPESLAMFIIPFDIAPIQSFSILKTLAGLVMIILIIILFFKNKERTKKEKIFCFAWFLILMFPPMVYKGALIDYLNHRFFLPLTGILLFLLFIFPEKSLKRGNIKISWLMVAVMIFLCSFTFIRSRYYSDPMTFYNSAITQNPSSAIAYYNRGYIKSARNDFRGAIEDYNKAIVIHPNYPEAYNNRGNMKNAMSDFQGAVEDYNKAIAIYPSYDQAYYNRGVVKLNRGDELGAIEDYNKAVAINPNYVDAYINRSVARYCLKDLTGAIMDCKKVLELDPGNEKIRNFKNKIQQELNAANN